MKYRVYYADGTTYDGDTQNIEDVKNTPASRALIVKTETETRPGFAMRYGCDFFGWCKLLKSDGGWEGKYYWSGMNDLIGLANYLYTMRGEMHKLLIGIEVADSHFQDVKDRALAEGCLCEGMCDHRR